LNPYSDIPVDEGLTDNTLSPYYGRWRLEVNQVKPFREPNYDSAVIKVFEGSEEEA
jgi:hypothetical protein